MSPTSYHLLYPATSEAGALYETISVCQYLFQEKDIAMDTGGIAALLSR